MQQTLTRPGAVQFGLFAHLAPPSSRCLRILVSTLETCFYLIKA